MTRMREHEKRGQDKQKAETIGLAALFSMSMTIGAKIGPSTRTTPRARVCTLARPLPSAHTWPEAAAVSTGG